MRKLILLWNLLDMIKKEELQVTRFSLLKSPGNAILGIVCESAEIIESIDFYRSLER